MKKRLLAVAAIFLISVSCSQAADKTLVDVTQLNVAAFIDEMVETHDFDRDALASVLAEAEIRQTIVEKISTPAERKLSWSEYRRSSLPGSASQPAQHSGLRIARCSSAFRENPASRSR